MISNQNDSKKHRDCYPLSYGDFLILSSLLFWAHSFLPSYSPTGSLPRFVPLSPFLASQRYSLNVFRFLCLRVCILNECPVSPCRWMHLFMVFSHILFLGHNRLKDFLAGEVNSRTIETSSYGGGQHASKYRGSITGKAP